MDTDGRHTRIHREGSPLMHTELQESDRTVAAWRDGTGADSPAGPLFTGGAYAESELTASGQVRTVQCGTVCSWSAGRECC